jgi:hypothetical protein
MDPDHVTDADLDRTIELYGRSIQQLIDGPGD